MRDLKDFSFKYRLSLICRSLYSLYLQNIAFWFPTFFVFETALNRKVFVGYSTLSNKVQILVAQSLLDAWLLNFSFAARTSCGCKTTNTAFLKGLIALSTNKAHHCVDFLCLTFLSLLRSSILQPKVPKTVPPTVPQNQGLHRASLWVF